MEAFEILLKLLGNLIRGALEAIEFFWEMLIWTPLMILVVTPIFLSTAPGVRFLREMLKGELSNTQIALGVSYLMAGALAMALVGMLVQRMLLWLRSISDTPPPKKATIARARSAHAEDEG